MRLWYQSTVPLGHLPRYRAALEAHFARVASPGTEVVVRGATDARFGGRVPADLFNFPYAKHVIQSEMLVFCETAEREGYDAFILGSFSEPYLTEARSLVNIPVVSMPEAALLTSCALAPRFALVSLSPRSARRVRALVVQHGLSSRVTEVVPLPDAPGERELEAALEAPEALVAAFETVGRQAIANGADLILPAEGVFNEVLAGQGLSRLDRVPVMDCVGAVILQAELMVNLRQRMGLTVGREWAYARPEAEVLAEVRALAAGLAG